MSQCISYLWLIKIEIEGKGFRYCGRYSMTRRMKKRKQPTGMKFVHTYVETKQF